MANDDVPGRELQCKNQAPSHETSYLQQHHGLLELDMPGPSSMHGVLGPSCDHMSPPPPPLAPSLDDNFLSTGSTSTSSDSKLPSSTTSLMPPQITISWPNDGTLTVSWVTDLMQTFDWASRALISSEFSSVFPVQTFNKLALTASNILNKEPNCVRIMKTQSWIRNQGFSSRGCAWSAA